MCVLLPNVFPVTQFFPHVDCVNLVPGVSHSSLIILCLKAPVLQLVFVGPERLSLCSCVSYVPSVPCWTIKTLVFVNCSSPSSVIS